jgi:hypothetical protein
MQDQNESTSAALDLTHYTEATRRELYDRLVRLLRASPEGPPGARESAAVEGETEPVPEFDPMASQLMAFHAFGRWFAAWTSLDVPEGLPEHLRWELVRIQPSPESPEGIMLFEV